MPDQERNNSRPKEVIFDPNISPWEPQYRSSDGLSYYRRDVQRNITQFRIKCSYRPDEDCLCEQINTGRRNCNYIRGSQDRLPM